MLPNRVGWSALSSCHVRIAGKLLMPVPVFPGNRLLVFLLICKNSLYIEDIVALSYMLQSVFPIFKSMVTVLMLCRKF